MSVPASVIAARFMRLAQEHPQDAADIFERAAKTFANFAMDPRYAGRKGEYELFSREFAKAIPAAPATGVADDFEEQLDASAESYAQSDLPLGSISRDLDEEARERSIVPPSTDVTRISIAPASVDDKTVFGRVVKLKYAPSPEEMRQNIFQSDTVCFWQGKKQEAQAITVDVGTFPLLDGTLPNPPTDLSIRPYGIVEYGSDGFRSQVKFDVGTGTRFTIVGNYVSVTVGVDPPALEDPLHPDTSGFKPTAVLRVGGSIGMFAAPSQAPTVLTTYIDLLLNGASTSYIPRPAKSQFILPIQSSDPTGSCTVLFLGYVGFGYPALTTINIPAGSQISPIPIPNDCLSIALINTGGAPANFRIPWQLSL